MITQKKLLGYGLWFLAGSIISKFEKEKIYEEAKAYQRQSGKMGLVVGSGPFNLGEGFVHTDIIPQPNVSNFMIVDINRPLPFADKEFSSVVCSHVIEHVGSPYTILAELNRVADKVFVIYPDWWTAGATSVPSHKWIVVKDESMPYGLRFYKWTALYFWFPFSML